MILKLFLISLLFNFICSSYKRGELDKYKENIFTYAEMYLPWVESNFQITIYENSKPLFRDDPDRYNSVYYSMTLTHIFFSNICHRNQ